MLFFDDFIYKTKFNNDIMYSMKNKFLILWFAGIVGAIAVLPYAFTLQHDVIEKSNTSLPFIVFVSIVQTAVLLAIAVFFGLKLSERLHLSIFTLLGTNVSIKKKLLGIIMLAVPAGILTALAIALGDMLFGQYIPQLTVVNAQVAVWKTLLASLYGGIVEELLLRLFVMLLIAWIIAKITRSIEPAKNSIIMWTAIILSAVLFGLGHLPITASLVAITPIVIVRAIVLNGIGGLVFGWLFWKKGLESAIIAHFTADIVLLSILPLIIK